jgi:hypothetical protein
MEEVINVFTFLTEEVVLGFCNFNCGFNFFGISFDQSSRYFMSFLRGEGGSPKKSFSSNLFDIYINRNIILSIILYFQYKGCVIQTVARNTLQLKSCYRLTINNCILDRIPVSKILGVWLSEDLSWDRNTKEMCRRAYCRMSMLTKLKYVGVSTEDLIDIFILFIRSLTVAQATDIERIQKTSLKVILGDNYVSY